MGATRRELKRASAFGTKPVLAEAIELYPKRSICSHFHLSVLIGARIGAERLQADDCSTAGDGTRGYSHLRGIRPEAAALGEDVGCSAAAKLSNEEGHLVRRITPLLAPSTTDCTKGPHGVSHRVFGSKPLLMRRGTSVRGEPSTSWRPLLITINQHCKSTWPKPATSLPSARWPQRTVSATEAVRPGRRFPTLK